MLKKLTSSCSAIDLALSRDVRTASAPKRQ